MLGLGNSITSGVALSSDFTPTSLGSTLLAWYQFNTGQTNLSGTDGNADNEMKWADQSGNSRHATQRTDAEKPAFTSGYVDFEDTSVSDHLEIQGTAIELGTNGSDAATIIIALRRESEGTDRFLGQATQEFMGFVGNDTSLQTRSASTQSTNAFADNPFPINEVLVLTYTIDGDRHQSFYKNNSELTFTSESNPLAGTQLDIAFIGHHKNNDSANSFDGRIYEVIICDTVLSDADRQAATSYVMSSVGL